MHPSRTAVPALACALLAVVTGCSASSSGSGPATPRPSPAGATSADSGTPQSPAATSTGSATRPSRADTPRVVNASLTIPSINIRSLRIVPYEGTTDDRPGTRIQDRGIAASPYGTHGGVGPGQVGNYLVTAHRLAAGGPLHRLPSVEAGDRVLVTAGGTVYTYRITETRTTSFRSERSLAQQRAAVPGAPGKVPNRAMITLSTCATPEDNAAGNLWRDANGNPEHRIDKIGVLVDTAQASAP
jgi:sortase A